jgi:predicted secreted hydrolase
MRSSVLIALFCLLASGGAGAQYQQALPGYHYEFPRDHFSHPDYRTEWWYYTGNLKSADGQRFGFELTFFRQAVTRDASSSPWHIEDLYMAHLALSDLSGRRFYHDEHLNRAGPGIAGIDDRTGVIWNGNWQVQLGASRQALRALTNQFEIQLDLATAKPPVIHGRDGISRKAAGTGRGSHYISLTRLIASGNISLDGKAIPVEGTAWMDHEFFSDAMDPSESGWDWLSLQLDDRSEVMLYRLRHQDGTVDPYSSGSYIDANGHCEFLSSNDFTMTPAGQTWTSLNTRGTYPIRWRVAIPRLGLEAEITTALPNQEIPSGFGPSYWEGAIDINGKRGAGSLRGVGYLEMTGYAAAMHEWFAASNP